MRFRNLITLSLLAAILIVPAQAQARPKIAFSDNDTRTLLDKRFQATGIKQVRRNVPYDEIANGGRRLALLDQWFATAQLQGVEPLVSFYRSRKGKKRLPTVAGYRKYFRMFRKRYPWVKHYSTFNEANFPDAQPTGNFPKRTAQFYKVARRECARQCTVLTNDFRADGSAHSRWWLKVFKRNMGRGPHTWGLVSHPDVNRSSTKRTRQFLRSVRGNVWAVEVGAVNYFGKLRPNIKRQTKSMRFVMGRYRRVSSRIKRMYIYHWRAGPRSSVWDSGLLSRKGGRRPAYFIFFKALRKKAP
jgi:hypothetical protein